MPILNNLTVNEIVEGPQYDGVAIVTKDTVIDEVVDSLELNLGTVVEVFVHVLTTVVISANE